jgi:hypothetical protein
LSSARVFFLKCFLPLRAVVEEVHAHSDTDAHFFEDLLARLAINDVISHMESVLELIDSRGWEVLPKPGMRLSRCRGPMDVLCGRLTMVLSHGGKVLERAGAGLEAPLTEMVIGH